MSEYQLNFSDMAPSRKVKSRRQTHYEWRLGEEPPVLGLHSLAKHNVLNEYLQKYVAILAARPEQDHLKLTLVDGFSGGGSYIHPENGTRLPGSPLIMVNAMVAAEEVANSSRRKKFVLDVEYAFVEKLPATIDYLRNELLQSEPAAKHRDRFNILSGSFSDHLESILQRVEQRGRSRRVIFVLDQYGFTDVRMSDLRRIFFRLPNAEVILTVAIDWLIDHWTEKLRYDKILNELGIDLPPEFAQHVKEAAPNDWRPIIQNALHAEFKRSSGAAFYTPFFIHSVDSHRAYWLLHFSGHSKARDVMQQLHWELENHFQHFGRPGFGMLGFNPRNAQCDLSQLTLPYGFDASAAAVTRLALLDELPRRIDKAGTTFSDFFTLVANETPATKQMLASFISELTLEKELEILTAEGKRRHNGVQVQSDDIIRRPHQTIFLANQAR